MALSRKLNQEQKEEIKDHEFRIERVKDTKHGVFFDMCINDVTIYGCSWVEGTKNDGSDYEFVSFPSHKGKDDKYYNYVYVKLSDNDTAAIKEYLQATINKAEE